MSKLLVFSLAVLFNAGSGWTQTEAPPKAYTAVTMRNSMKGPIVEAKIYRDGSKAVVDRTVLLPPSAPSSPGSSRARTYYGLDTHQWFRTDLNLGPSRYADQPFSASPNCTTGTFSDGWGDPFEESARLMREVNKRNPQQIGTEMVNGFRTRVLESTGSDKIKVWLDTRYGLVIKAESGGRTIFEAKKLTVAEPKASLLTVPPYCEFAAR